MDRIFCHFGPYFTLFPPNIPKKQNFEEMKKPYRDIITLHMCAINGNHMYGSWDMECVTAEFLSFWTIFCRFNKVEASKFTTLLKKRLHHACFPVNIVNTEILRTDFCMEHLCWLLLKMVEQFLRNSNLTLEGFLQKNL